MAMTVARIMAAVILLGIHSGSFNITREYLQFRLFTLPIFGIKKHENYRHRHLKRTKLLVGALV